MNWSFIYTGVESEAEIWSEATARCQTAGLHNKVASTVLST